MALTTLSLLFRSAVITLVIAQSTTDTLKARCTPMTNLQARAGAKNRKYKEDYAAAGTGVSPAIVSVAGQFIPSFFVYCGYWLTNTRENTMRSSAQRRRFAARLSRGVEHARFVLARRLLASPSLMPPPHAYTSLCTVQLRCRVVNLASPFHRLNASCTALRMHRTAPRLAPLST